MMGKGPLSMVEPAFIRVFQNLAPRDVYQEEMDYGAKN